MNNYVGIIENCNSLKLLQQLLEASITKRSVFQDGITDNWASRLSALECRIIPFFTTFNDAIYSASKIHPHHDYRDNFSKFCTRFVSFTKRADHL